MSQLIEELKSDHTALSNLLGEVQKLGSTSEQARDLLLQAKNALLNHLTKEDQLLYPPLKKAAEKDESIQRKLNTFAKDMEEISSFVLNFFSKVESNSYSNMEYARDFGRLVSVLSSRIRREETILYLMYDEII